VGQSPLKSADKTNKNKPKRRVLTAKKSQIIDLDSSGEDTEDDDSDFEIV